MADVVTEGACAGFGNSAFIIFLIFILLILGLSCFGGCI
ncbi:MAG: hypothetical protein A4E55_00616 [Pelotomaculum sp. PtaU1.Bin035]|nr:MAG: hypothetical protein A4E55_00616 [Pelotomaculum sp. PtaU1.Bin035]